MSVVQMNARRAGVVPYWCGRHMQVPLQNSDRDAEPGIAADRFAREIVRFLT
jgi:hypothetical protein